MPEHHDTGEEKGGGVGESLSSDVGGGSVNGLEDGGVSSDVSGGGESESTDESGAHVGEDVSVQVRRDEDSVGERRRVLDNL